MLTGSFLNIPNHSHGMYSMSGRMLRDGLLKGYFLMKARGYSVIPLNTWQESLSGGQESSLMLILVERID